MQPVGFGLLASFALLALYGGTMTALSGLQAAIEQFQALWFLMLPLAAGFGVQVGLYTKIKAAIRDKANAALATGGTSAGVSMLACCAHHATDVLPLVGLSGISIFLTRYQIPLLVVSLTINGMGIYSMLRHLQKL